MTTQCPKCGGDDFVTMSNGHRDGKSRTKQVCLPCKRAIDRVYVKALWKRLHREVLTHYSGGTPKCSLCPHEALRMAS